MPKIQNWSQVWKEPKNDGRIHVTKWDNEHGRSITVAKFEEDTDWMVVLKDQEGRDKENLFTGIDTRDKAEKLAREWMKKHPYADRSFWIDSDSEYESLQDAENHLTQRFREFEEENESFFFECVVHDDEGFTAVVSVDFGVEDFEEDWSYPANIMAFKDEQPMDDKETIVESSAVYQAEQIVRNGAMKGLSYYGEKPRSPGAPRIRQEYEDRGDQITGFMDIMWRKPDR